MRKTTITPDEYAELKRLSEAYAKALEQAPILVVDNDNAVRDVVVRMLFAHRSVLQLLQCRLPPPDDARAETFISGTRTMPLESYGAPRRG
jgi:hypothetical protein